MNLVIKKIVFVLFITSLGGANANVPYGNLPWKPSPYVDEGRIYHGTRHISQ